MNVADNASLDVHTHGGGEIPPSTGLTPDALPKVQEPVMAENSHTGVSTRNVPLPREMQEARRSARTPRWYALRVTYGRERQTYDYLVAKHVEAFYPTIKITREVDGKRKTIEESRIPNIFFARGTEEQIKSFVYDNVNLPHLRFYYKNTLKGARFVREPLIVPDQQMESLRILCASEAKDVIIVSSEIQKFQSGQTVRVIDGAFKGVIGKVARYHGQQRVAIIIEGVLTIASAYVPSAFLEHIL